MSVWGDIADVAKDVAPTVATAVGGPAAGGAAKVLTSFFGGSEDEPEKILENMKADPELKVKLQKMEQDHAEEMRSLTIKAEANSMEHDTKRMAEINQTMRSEYKNDVYWRRAVGWSFALVVFLYPVGIIASIMTDAMSGEDLGKILSSMAPYWYMVGAVLGIGAHHVGKRERTESGEKGNGGISGMISAMRGK